MNALSQEIEKAHALLMHLVSPLPRSLRTVKEIEGTGGKVSVADLIAYQIGWGKCLISWYKAGIKNQMPQMPGDGFTTWDYTAIARHFYAKYGYDHYHKQEEVFHEVVKEIIGIVEKEQDRLNKTGIWPWCTLASGKEWPLGKWIKINTSSPYKRAASLIKKFI